MIRILVISDTHGRIGNLKHILPIVRPDYLIHLGDVGNDVAAIEAAAGCPCAFVAGNNDFFSGLPSERVAVYGGVTVFMTHGHRYYVNSQKHSLRQAAEAAGAQVALFGHTHVPLILTEQEDAQYHGPDLINPGSLSLPRQADHKPTYLVMTIGENKERSYELHRVE